MAKSKHKFQFQSVTVTDRNGNIKGYKIEGREGSGAWTYFGPASTKEEADFLVKKATENYSKFGPEEKVKA